MGASREAWAPASDRPNDRNWVWRASAARSQVRNYGITTARSKAIKSPGSVAWDTIDLRIPVHRADSYGSRLTREHAATCVPSDVVTDMCNDESRVADGCEFASVIIEVTASGLAGAVPTRAASKCNVAICKTSREISADYFV